MAEPGPLGAGSSALALTASDGVRLRGAILPGGGRGVVLLLPGRTEFCEKYAGVAAECAARGFAVASLDWRGQGASARPVGHPRKGHVDDFCAFQRDLAALLAAGPVAAAPGPRVMVAHSMGGAIGLRALVDGRLTVSAAVFCAPMWGLAQGRAVALAGRLMAEAAVALGMARAYAPGGGDASYASTDPEPNVLTADPEQAAWLAALTRAHADKALGGPTFGWLRAAYREMAALAPLRLRAPAMAAVGGDEGVVSKAAIRARAARDGLPLTEIAGGRHELFIETPPRRARLWAAIDGFLADQKL